MSFIIDFSCWWTRIQYGVCYLKHAISIVRKLFVYRMVQNHLSVNFDKQLEDLSSSSISILYVATKNIDFLKVKMLLLGEIN